MMKNKTILKELVTTMLYQMGSKSFVFDNDTNKIKTENFPRPCINCGKKHTHNQPWCSSLCATEWRLTHRRQGKTEHVARLQAARK
jgi:hypothetical protein